MNYNTANILITARNLLINGHCKGAYARTPDGKAVNSWNDEAVCFCMVGALVKTRIDFIQEIKKRLSDKEIEEEEYTELLSIIEYSSSEASKAIRKSINQENIHTWNDLHTKDEVIYFFDKEIESLLE